jgi:hypothetical protein
LIFSEIAAMRRYASGAIYADVNENGADEERLSEKQIVF